MGKLVSTGKRGRCQRSFLKPGFYPRKHGNARNRTSLRAPIFAPRHPNRPRHRARRWCCRNGRRRIRPFAGGVSGSPCCELSVFVRGVGGCADTDWSVVDEIDVPPLRHPGLELGSRFLSYVSEEAGPIVQVRTSPGRSQPCPGGHGGLLDQARGDEGGVACGRCAAARRSWSRSSAGAIRARAAHARRFAKCGMTSGRLRWRGAGGLSAVNDRQVNVSPTR